MVVSERMRKPAVECHMKGDGHLETREKEGGLGAEEVKAVAKHPQRRRSNQR